MLYWAAAPGEIYQVSQCAFAFFDVNDTLDATARPTDRAEKGTNRARTSLANAFKWKSGLMTVLQRTNGITAEQKRLGRQFSDRLTSKPLCGSAEMKEKLKGKFVEEQVRLVVPSKETAKMITEGIIKTKLHVAACSGANSTDGTDAMRSWGFGGLALEKLNNPITTSVERIPHTITDDTAVVAWMGAFVAATAADETVLSCTHHCWTKDGGDAFEVAPVNANADAVVIWQIEEWVLGANSATKLSVDPSEAAPHKIAVSYQNPTPIKLEKAIERTMEGAGIKTTDWRRSHRPGLPWFAAAEATGGVDTGRAEFDDGDAAGSVWLVGCLRGTHRGYQDGVDSDDHEAIGSNYQVG